MDSLHKIRKINDVTHDVSASKIPCTVKNCRIESSTTNLVAKIATLNVAQLKQQLKKRGCRKIPGKKKDLQDRYDPKLFLKLFPNLVY